MDLADLKVTFDMTGHIFAILLVLQSFVLVMFLKIYSLNYRSKENIFFWGLNSPLPNLPQKAQNLNLYKMRRFSNKTQRGHILHCNIGIGRMRDCTILHIFAFFASIAFSEFPKIMFFHPQFCRNS